MKSARQAGYLLACVAACALALSVGGLAGVLFVFVAVL